MHILDRGKPLAAEQSFEHRPRELRLPLVEVGAVCRVRDAVAGPERLDQLVERTDRGRDELPYRRDEVQTRLVEQSLVVSGWERVATLRGVDFSILDVQDP